MGGDEFAVLFFERDRTFAINKVNHIQKMLNSYRFEWEVENFTVSASMGLIEVDESFHGVNHLVSTAERTCYEAKQKGGEELSFYNLTKDFIDQSERQMRWIPILRRAVDDNMLFLCGQKIRNLHTDKDEKMEVLVRLDGEGGQVIPPDSFIPIAERYHLISAIDKWVVKTMLEEGDNIFGQGVQYCINLSGESINKSSFVSWMEDMIKKSNIPEGKVCFEITETSALSDIESTRKFIEQFKRLGCKFSLDDFGTGTSSYGYLKQLPVDYVKVDGIFVRDIEHERISRLMVESITAIAKEMGIQVVAECVETEEAAKILREIGVDFAQGYLVHQPTRFSALLE